MVLAQDRKLDQHNRVFIPMEYIRRAGGEPNGKVYVCFDEESKEITLRFPEEKKGGTLE